jgi:hypothetical protein
MTPATPHDGAVPPTNPGTLRIAVVSDGSGYRPNPTAARPFDVVLGEVATIIGGLGQMRTTPIVIRPDTDAELTLQVRQLPDDVAATYLALVDAARARTVQRELEAAGGRQALTDEDASGIALTAACMRHLHRIDRDPAQARVLVAGASKMPGLAMLLMACGVFDVSLWNRTDERWFPLNRAARDADVVLDLLHDPTSTALGYDRPDGSVIPSFELDGQTLAAPGILRAITRYPPGLVELDVALYRDCALALATALPDRRQWSTLLRNPRLVDAVELSVHRSVRGRRPD